jgi:hypothetical protein
LRCKRNKYNKEKIKREILKIWREQINLDVALSIQFVLSSCNLIQYVIMLITISIYKGYLPSSPTTAKFEALLPTHNNGQHCWVSCIYYILKELDMLKMFKSPLTCGAREINIIRKK